MRAWWLLAFFARFAGAAPDLLFHAPDGRVPLFAPRPPVPNPVDDPDWLVAASGSCSDFSFAPDGSIDFKFHPEVSVAFTDAPFHQAASLEDGIEIRGEEYSQTDVLAAGTWTNKNIALLEPTSSCDDPPAGSQDEWAVSVFKVTGTEACGEECVHFSGLVSGASDNFVARKEGRFLCQLFVESHTFSDQARRSLRRRLAPTPLMTNMHMQPTARQPAFAPVADIDLTASWLVATAGICSDLSVTPKSETVAAESDADQSGTFVADITFKFHPSTSVAYTKSPDHGAVEIGEDGVVVHDKAYSAVEVLSAAAWDLKNIALLEPTSSCDDPPAGSQDEWAVSVFKVSASDKCGADCVLYSGRVSSSSSRDSQKNGRFPCQLYVDGSNKCPPRNCNKNSDCACDGSTTTYCNTQGIGSYCTKGKTGDRCSDSSQCDPAYFCSLDMVNECTAFSCSREKQKGMQDDNFYCDRQCRYHLDAHPTATSSSTTPIQLAPGNVEGAFWNRCIQGSPIKTGGGKMCKCYDASTGSAFDDVPYETDYAVNGPPFLDGRNNQNTYTNAKPFYTDAWASTYETQFFCTLDTSDPDALPTTEMFPEEERLACFAAASANKTGREEAIARCAAFRKSVEAGTKRILHCGRCGACSAQYDINVIYTTRNSITDDMTACSSGWVTSQTVTLTAKTLRGLETCLEDVRPNPIDFTTDGAAWEDPTNKPSCMDVWTDNILNDANVCGAAYCLGKFLDSSNAGDFAKDQCLQCDEYKSGPAFIKGAGANRRSSGITSDIDRSQLADTPWEQRICAVGWFSPIVPEGVAGDAAGACSCRTSGMIDEVSPCDCPCANE